MSTFKIRLRTLAVLMLFAPLSPAAATDTTLNDDLLYRINFGSAEDVRMLLAKGADPNARTRQGETALNVAMERNDLESEKMAEALVDKGANMDAPDRDNNPPVITAVKYKLTDLVKLMISKGVSYHTLAPDGTPLIDYARKYGSKEMVETIQDLIGKEDAAAAALRSPDRFKQIVVRYTMDSCTYQYWSFFVASRQAPERDTENQKKIDDAKSRLYQQINQLQPYYTGTSINAMIKVANDGVQQIYSQLDDMISNTNRSEHGIGTDADAKSRCDKILAGLPMNIQPVPTPATPVAPPSAPAGQQRAPSAQVPLLDQSSEGMAAPSVEAKPTPAR